MNNQLITENLIPRILDELPDAVTFMQPVFHCADVSGDSLPVDFVFTYINEKAAALGGLPKELLTGKTIFTTPKITIAGRELFEQLISVYKSGGPCEFSYIHPVTQAKIDVLRSCFQNGILSISRDRTAQQRAENELLKKNEQLENSISELQHSNENLERYAHAASHDLQEPLRKIITYSEMLERRYREVLGDDGKNMVDKMKDAGFRMDKLIKDLLNYSRLSDNQQVFDKVDLNQVVADVITDLETVLAKTGASVQVEQLQPVSGSGLQMRQLFQNLISNSLKFTRADTVPAIYISATISVGKNSGVEVSKTDENTSFQVIVVNDNGIGFDPLQAGQIFQIFRRLHGKNYPGTGIGLSIVKKVIEQHGGYIAAKGEPGKGATFIILLPLAD